MKNNYDSFDAILRAWLDQNDIQRSKHRDFNWWWASELGMCKRKHFFRRMNLVHSNDKPYRIKFIAEDGTAGHNWREAAVEKMGVLIAKEGRLKDEDYKYKGRFDVMVDLGGKPVLIDIKTQRPEAFFRRRQRTPGTQVSDFQKKQLASYVFFSNRSGKYPQVEEARLYFVDRGGGVRDEYVFHFKQKMFDSVTKELNTLNKCWETQKFPRTKKGWLCNYCPYKSLCKKVDSLKLTVEQTQQTYGQNNGKIKTKTKNTN